MRRKGWTCQRVTKGERCGRLNLSRKRTCSLCGKPRPAQKKPAHMTALALSYEDYVKINGGEHCGICGAVQKEGGKRLHRDHCHRTGTPRGLLCWPCNRALTTSIDPEWLRLAIRYLERTA